jgi:hypothetical protein
MDNARRARVPRRCRDERPIHLRCWTRSTTYRGEPAVKERKDLLPHRLFKDPPVYVIMFDFVKFRVR